MKEILTIARAGEARYEIQRSKFIARAAYANDPQAVRTLLKSMKKEFFGARHSPFAYVLGEDGSVQKSSDDGEPGGTAGSPILERIKNFRLTDALVVVVRYFGGIKLGAPGLIRAYGHAADLALRDAHLVRMQISHPVFLTIDYGLFAAVEHFLTQQEIRTGEKRYADRVTIELLLPEEATEAALLALADLTAGKLQIERLPARKIAVPLSSGD